MNNSQHRNGEPQETAKDTATEKFHVAAPTLSLPKGGGAIRGIGEKFAANPVTGTGSLSVPISTSPGRSGFGPQLALSYDSGSGNGTFGSGWSLSIPSITRKTDKGLPKYRDADESDVFILSGAEDLVPQLVEQGGQWQRQPFDRQLADGTIYVVQRYRPRIEGLFARIERWTNKQTGESHWRSISRDNITTFYGKTSASRIADPANPLHVFSWLICETYDDRGNAVAYEYKGEDSDNVDRAAIHEKNRLTGNAFAQRYMKRIKYGNPAPLTPNSTITNMTWMFEVVFDYGEHDQDKPTPTDTGTWLCRHDPFSSYRAGFEVRTYRLCQRVLMFHRFAELGATPCLVRSTDFAYRNDRNKPEDHKQGHPIASFIEAITQTGYKRQANGTYVKKSLPELQFEYTRAVVRDEVKMLDADSMENLPYGLDGTHYQWVDLNGEGLSGILTEQADAWFYKPNRGNGKLGAAQLLGTKPSLADVSGGRQQFLDLAGDGQLDLVQLDSPVPGYYERTVDEDWETFVAFASVPNVPWNDPNLKFVDLTGDGHADILTSDAESFTWYPSLAESGFGASETMRKLADEEQGPTLVFADGTQSVYLADMSGDGLSDIVRIRNGEVSYWPNLGYGCFGAKVTMRDAPWFDAPEQFDQRRMRLADIDGSGVTDIIYLGRSDIRCWFNQSGNGWSAPQRLTSFPRTDNLASVTAVDLLGNGTACLVWSSPLPGDTRRPMRYIDLMGGQKPHLLISVKNNLGAETRVHYAPSTQFYLADKVAGTPWVTRLPFPVHVVERVETYDHISRNRFVTRYSYHHGYFDGIEREFRGFGRVEQLDTEAFAALTAAGTLPEATNVDAASHVPPVLTKTWFHTGIYLGGTRVSNFFAGLLDANDKGEYYREPGLDDVQASQRLLDDTVLPTALTPPLTPQEEREACRALKGAMLRQEVYALDGTDQQEHPYVVTEQNFTIERLQPQAGNRHGVFFPHTREALSYHYERDPKDPRVSHALTLEVDAFGNVLKSVAIGYGRKTSPLGEIFDQSRQTQSLITYTEQRVTNPIDERDAYRTPLPAETRTYELTGYVVPNVRNRFTSADFVRDNQGRIEPVFDDETNYEDTPGAGRQRRLIEHVRTLYRRDDLTGLSPLGTVMPMALPGESYKLAFTPGLLASIYRRLPANGPAENLLPNAATVLSGKGSDEGGYVDLDGNGHWWLPSGRSFYDPGANITNPAATAALELAEARRHFFLPRKFADPFNQSATVGYDSHDLLVVKTEDALRNTMTAEHDYRVLAPHLMTDPNGNRSEAAFDTLGLVVATAVRGKENETLGDLLEGFDPDPPLTVLQTFVSDPGGQAASLLGKATTRIVYDLDRFTRSGQPPFAATLARETHFLAPGGAQSKIQIGVSYSDGFGREIQKKIQAERGDAPQRTPNVTLASSDVRPGELIRDANGQPVQATTAPRWVGNGRTVFNNKGKPVKQYEPFFSSTHLYEAERDMTDTGVSPVLFYDPVERVVATLHPNHTYEKVVFDPWQQTTYDVNDTVAPRGTETGDPRTDPDIRGYVREYFKTQPTTWQTWHRQRIGGAMGAAERSTAAQAAKHANTPTVAHFDTLGRPFLTIAHNRFDRNNIEVEEKYSTRVVLDIEGNQRAVRDARVRDPVTQAVDPLGRVVMQYDYDMLGTRIHQASMEAGERWMLNDVTGKPIRAWDSRRFMRRMAYDELRRPTGLFVTENGAERLAERTVYGEGQGTANNHRTRIFQVFDGAGRVTSEAYDFKGNLLRSRRDLLPDYKRAVNWLQNPTPNDGTLTSSTTYDALNRPTAVTAPDNSIYRPTYNDANLLEKVDVNLHGATTTTPFVTNIDYNAKGQRTLIRYGSDAQTTYDYDKETFRLTHLKTTRPPGRNGLASQIFANPATVQDLRYTYDPAGNITRIADEALKRVTHAGQIVEPVCRYTYDAIYRLIEATGREHIDQTAFQFAPPDCNYRDYPFVGPAPTNDLQAVRNYTERYVYDPVGNFERMIHDAANGGWTRAYEYAETSLIEDGLQVSPRKTSNRLSRTLLHPDSPQPLREPYTYDPHGNMTTMPHLPLVQWDFKDQLRASSKQVTTTCPPETTFYVYDAAGQRVRKVTERQNGTRKDERIYLGGFEVYREYNGNGQTVTLERETVHVMDNQQRIALVETKTRASGLLNNLGRLFSGPETLVRYQLGNHLGSASLELDKNGGLISYEEYHPYGTTAYQAITSAAEGSLKRYRYTGKERDAESGLYYHGARYYAAWLARWTAADPAGMIDGSNVYLYVAACPIRFRDRDGRQLHPDMMESMRQDYEERRNSALDVQEKAEWDAYRRKLILEGNYDVNVEDNPDLQALKEQHIEDERQATEDTVAGESLESGGVGFAISAIIERKSRGVSPNARDFATVGRPLANTARARAATPSTAPPMPAVTATTKPPAPPPPPSVTAGPPKKPLPPPKPPTNASSAGSAPPAAPPTGAPAAQRGRNITISGTMSEEEFRGSMKTEPGVYVYVIVDAQGNVSKPGTTTDPYKRFNDYVNKEGMGTAQMRVYRAHGKYQALGGETAAIAAETERGSGTMNDRLETRTEMRQGGEWTDSLYQPPAPSGPPLITIKR